MCIELPGRSSKSLRALLVILHTDLLRFWPPQVLAESSLLPPLLCQHSWMLTKSTFLALHQPFRLTTHNMTNTNMSSAAVDTVDPNAQPAAEPAAEPAATVPEDLPQDIWRLILQHVPLADRLGSASLVSTTLRAAAAASPALHAVMRKPARGVAYMQYIQLFGDCLTSLHLSVNLQPQLVLEQLPCQQLLELQLNNVELRLPSAFDSCTRLTHLDMDSCSSTVPSGTSAADVLACLSVFVKLQHLDINAFCTLLDTTAQRRRTRSRRSRRKQPPAPAGVLVETGILPGSVLDSLGGQLTHLSLFEMVVEDVDCLLSSQRLCVLDLQNLEQQPALSIVPGSLPTSVCDLYLGAGLELHPAVLPLHTQLTALHLDGVKLPRRGGGGDGDAATSDGMLVLSALAELPSLSELSLIDLAGVDWPAPGPVYTALRASSTLAGLTVLNCGLPHGVWECVFRPGAPKLTGLRSLCTYTWDWDAGNEVIGSTDFSMWEVLAVRRLVGCARGLEKWSLVLQDSPAITRSFRLRSIKELDLLLWHNADGLPSQEASLVGSVAGLLSLQRLRLDFISLDPNTWQSLLPLVALTELTHFHIKTATKSLELHNKAPPNDPPDVWVQLLHACESDQGPDQDDDNDSFYSGGSGESDDSED